LQEQITKLLGNQEMLLDKIAFFSVQQGDDDLPDNVSHKGQTQLSLSLSNSKRMLHTHIPPGLDEQSLSKMEKHNGYHASSYSVPARGHAGAYGQTDYAKMTLVKRKNAKVSSRKSSHRQSNSDLQGVME